MRIRKALMAGCMGLMLSGLMVVPVSAHGHHRQSTRQVTQEDTYYPVCTVEDCEETGCHLHDGEYYCGYDHDGGYCDGTCRPAARSASRGGHHGRIRGCH